MKLYWYEKLMVIGEFDASHKKQLKRINAGKFVSDIYLIMLSNREDAALEILLSQHINNNYYNQEKGYVIGAALSHELADELAARIAATVYLRGDTAEFADFFTEDFLKKPDVDSLICV